MFRKSLQTITWGDPQHDRFDRIFALASESGFHGLEIGFRRFSAVSIAELQELLDRHNLVLNASHIGGNLDDLGQAANERGTLDVALDYLSAVHAPYLLYSVLNDQIEAVLE